MHALEGIINFQPSGHKQPLSNRVLEEILRKTYCTQNRLHGYWLRAELQVAQPLGSRSSQLYLAGSATLSAGCLVTDRPARDVFTFQAKRKIQHLFTFLLRALQRGMLPSSCVEELYEPAPARWKDRNQVINSSESALQCLCNNEVLFARSICCKAAEPAWSSPCQARRGACCCQRWDRGSSPEANGHFATDWALVKTSCK